MLPTSPYNFRQEQYRHDPWKMLLVCMMLNQTTHVQVDRVRHEFFSRYPGPDELIAAPDDEVRELIRPLGLYNKRVRQWKRFSEEWRAWDGRRVKDLHGVGKYASDSWEIFQEGKIYITVEDKELKRYVAWARERASAGRRRAERRLRRIYSRTRRPHNNERDVKHNVEKEDGLRDLVGVLRRADRRIGGGGVVGGADRLRVRRRYGADAR